MTQKWLLPFKRSKRNYEDIGCMPWCLEHDRGFSGRKIYRVVRRLPDGVFVYMGTYGPIFNRHLAMRACRLQYEARIK